MGDPLTIGAGVVGVVAPALHGTRLLINDVERIIHAPEAIQNLQADLSSATLVIESLAALKEDEWQLLGAPVAEQAKASVKTCGSACDIFRNDLQRWTRRSRGGDLSWRDRANVGFFKERQIKAMSEHLQSCKLTCTSVMGMVTLYTSLRNGRMTEELKQTIATSQNNASSLTRQTDDQLALVQSSLQELDLGDFAPTNDDEEDDKVGAEAQLIEQQAALESCQKLFQELQSKLQKEQIEKVTAGRDANTTISIGNVTRGIGIGISNAPINNVTFGDVRATDPASP